MVFLSADSDPLMPFRALGLGDRIFKAIQEAGYSEPTPIQAAAIPQVLASNALGNRLSSHGSNSSRARFNSFGK